MPYEALPAELKQLPQWVLVRVFPDAERPGKTIKEPYQIDGINHASVSEPRTWSTFNAIVAAQQTIKWEGSQTLIGFVFTDRDPFTGVDLDATTDPEIIAFQTRIFEMFTTYAERSQSGQGLHLICRGKVPYGRRRNGVEVYSSKRYFVMTGDVYNHAPVNDCQTQLEWLINEMGAPPALLSHDGNAPQTQEDNAIFEIAKNAENGDKFLALWQGKWQDLDYPSQSEADLALYDIIAYYTKNAEQIRRMFMASELGNRPKALRDNYHAYMLAKVFDRDIPPVDIEGLEIGAQIALDKHKERELAKNTPPITRPDGTSERVVTGAERGDLAQEPVTTEANANSPTGERSLYASDGKTTGSIGNELPVVAPALDEQSSHRAGALPFKRNFKPYTLPPGLVGQIAQYIYHTAPRPVEEIALAAAIGFMAGICGRAYNVSATGLNLYLLVLAETGHGKEVVSSGIDGICGSIENECKSIYDFRGPSAIASGTAIINTLEQHPSVVSVIGEFGWKFKNMASDTASSADVGLRAMLLDLYSKSGAKQKLGASVWADKFKKIEAIQSPAFSLICESVPSVFYDVVSDRVIQDGLLPRFIIIDSKKERQYLNKTNIGLPPSADLQVSLVSLVTYVNKLTEQKQTVEVTITPEALERSDALDRFATDKIRETNSDITRHLWNRTHHNTLRLAALIAVGNNYLMPTITLEIFNWACDLVTSSVYGLLDRFEAGEIGEEQGSEHAQYKHLERVVREFMLVEDFKDVVSYKVTRQAFEAKAIQYSYLQGRLWKLPAFKNDKLGATRALKRTIETAVSHGLLVELGKIISGEKYGRASPTYLVADFAALRIGGG